MIDISREIQCRRPSRIPLFAISLHGGGKSCVDMMSWSRHRCLVCSTIRANGINEVITLMAGDLVPSSVSSDEVNVIASDWLAIIYNNVIIPSSGVPPITTISTVLKFLRDFRFDYIWTGKRFIKIIPLGAD